MDIKNERISKQTVNYAKSFNGSGSITFELYNPIIKVYNKNDKIMHTGKYWEYKNQNDPNYIYYQNICVIFQTLTDYNYPIEFKFKDLSNPQSELIFIYEGKEISLQELINLYEEFMDKSNSLGENISAREKRNLLLYSGNYVEQEKEEKEESYQKLLDDYTNFINSLPEEERKKFEDALLVYNSCLYEAINQLVSIQNFRNKDPLELFNILSENKDFRLTTRIFIRSIKAGKYCIENGDSSFNKDIYERLSIVNVNSKSEYIRSLIEVYDTIMKHKGKLKTTQDITLYRGLSGFTMENPEHMARSELISTSTNADIARKFFRSGENATFLKINVKEGTEYIVVPFKLVSEIKSYREGKELLKYIGIDHDRVLEDEEVLLFDSNIHMKPISNIVIDEGIRKINVLETEVSPVTKNLEDKGETNDFEL